MVKQEMVTRRANYRLLRSQYEKKAGGPAGVMGPIFDQYSDSPLIGSHLR